MNDQNKDLASLLESLAIFQKKWFDNLLAENKKISADDLYGIYSNIFDNAKIYLENNTNMYQNQLNFWKDYFNNNACSTMQDFRFSDKNWDDNPFFAYLKQSYLSFSQQILDFIDKSDVENQEKSKMRFFIQQYLDAIDPSNFMFTNPLAIKNLVETNGKSFIDGMQQMLQDVQDGYIKMTDESKFEVGANLAITSGKVIYRNNLIELIQYAPSNTNVYEVPLLIVPPCINKFYILDLQPENSLVKYLVDCGFTIYLISWKSADHTTSDYNWLDYIEYGVIDALKVVRSVSQKDKINTLGYCIGGLILTTAMLHLQNSGKYWVNSMTHVTTLLDHSEPGDIKHFVAPDLFNLKDLQTKFGCVVPGRVIAQTFSSLRSKELFWNYWVNNYLLGKVPEPFDILYWNNDVINLPLPMHTFLIERMYQNNDLINGLIKFNDSILDPVNISCPMYMFAAQKDHIVPWQSAFISTKLVGSELIRFVLGASGHTAGVINPVATNKRSYWINDDISKDANNWFKNATEIKGSWWNDYSTWLKQYSGKKIRAKKSFGNKDFSVICDAPGEYVLAKPRNTLF